MTTTPSQPNRDWKKEIKDVVFNIDCSINESEHIESKMVGIITQALAEQRAEIVRNHLEAMRDALSDSDTYGALSGLVHALEKYIASITEGKD